MAARLKDRFLNEITPALMQKFNYTTVMQVPKIEKVVINMGVGEAVSNSKVLDVAVEELANHLWSKTSCNTCQKIYRRIQTS